MNFFARRLPTVLALLLLVAGVVGTYFWIQSRKVPVEAGVVPQKVRITNVADNKFSVSWVTTSNTSGSVEYGKTGEKLTQTAKDERDSGTAGAYTTHHVTVGSLQPNTAYSFRILSGSRKTSFDNSGTPYSATTGPVIAGTPPAKSFYGTVQPGTAGSAEGALVYIALPGSAPASTLVKGSGTYTVSLPTMRTTDLKSYVTYDPSATIVTMTLESGKAQSTVSVSTANMAPVPTITLGKDADFRNALETPAVAEVTTTPAPSSSSSAQTPTVFNVEPLAEESINAVTNTSFSILNPAVEGETLATLRPEFRGTAPLDTTLTIALTGQKAVSDTITTEADGTWSWAPVIDLKTGKQTITVSYLATGGTTQKLSRGFTISTTKVTSDPAFVSSPSGSTKTSTASATPRAVMPATGSGVPTTGVLTLTLLTGIIGVVIMILGATLLAL